MCQVLIALRQLSKPLLLKMWSVEKQQEAFLFDTNTKPQIPTSSDQFRICIQKLPLGNLININV